MTVLREDLEPKLAAWCLAQEGVLWQHQARVPGSALDCVGLPVCALQAHGLPVVDMLDYSEVPLATQLIDCVAANCARADGPAAGRLVLFWIRNKHVGPTHAGVMLSASRFVHARRGRGDGRVEITELDARWLKRAHSFWSYDLAWRR